MSNHSLVHAGRPVRLCVSASGWQDLVVQACHEPMELEYWMTPAMPTITLILWHAALLQALSEFGLPAAFFTVSLLAFPFLVETRGT